ncbi:MAG: acetyl-CoA carboxylase, carboxyltransferase subunit beta [Termitinemataceae bacterium]|nr:MAG: acetyl-CoA carboxylase, carboxyltransferase subunit beta [Termitinemataceae bacterium]
MIDKENIVCPICGLEKNTEAIKNALMTCPSCGHHYRMEARDRLDYICDKDSFIEFASDMKSKNPIGFVGYDEKAASDAAKAKMNDAVITGCAKIDGKNVVLAIMSFSFMGGSMGSVVGEKITRAMMSAIKEKWPLIIYATSGGARMQEGIFSLMQMAKTSWGAAHLDKEAVPYFAVLCDPTSGGVSASFAMLADIIIAEPRALIGFAGPRVIEGTIREKLPENFQTSEFQLQHGFVDMILARCDQKKMISKLISLHTIPQGTSQGTSKGASK